MTNFCAQLKRWPEFPAFSFKSDWIQSEIERAEVSGGNFVPEVGEIVGQAGRKPAK